MMRLSDGIDRRDWLLSACVLLATLVGVFETNRRLLALRLNEARYTGGTPLADILGETSARRWAVYGVLLALIGGLEWAHRRSGRARGPGGIGRWVFTAALLVQTYSVAAMDYNHFYDSWFATERIALVITSALCWWRPLFLPGYLLQLIVLTGQLKYPALIGYDHVHKFIAVPILLAYWVQTVLGCFVRVRRAGELYALFVMALLSLWYINAGIGKLEIGWERQNSLYNLFAAATDAGWLEDWSRTTKLYLAEFLTGLRAPLLYGTIVLEIALPLLLFTTRRLAIVTAVSLMAFHLFVYLFSGILFWQWSVLELTFLGYLFLRPDGARELFGWRNRLAYLGLLVTIPFFFHIGKLSWFDCGYVNLYTFYLLDEAGEAHELNATYFSPYDTGFAKNRFYFTTPYRTISNTYGQCNDGRLLEIVEGWARTGDTTGVRAVEAYRSTYGQARYDTLRAGAFYHFLTEFVSSKNAYDPQLVSHLSPPPHMQQGGDQGNFRVPALRALRIVYEEKVILPGLEFFPVRQDTVTLPLPSS